MSDSPQVKSSTVPFVDPGRRAATTGTDSSFNLPALVLAVGAGCLMVLGVLLMLGTSIFVAVLGGALFAVGGSFLAGFLAFRALKQELRKSSV